MKVGGGLNYVTGPMGAGKTFYAVRRIIPQITSGQYVITNIELRPNWSEKVVKKVARYRGVGKYSEIQKRLESFYIYENDLHEAMRYRLPGDGEARGLFVWDEGQNDLNNRDWRKEGRDDILKWATQLRKLGFVGFLLSQHLDNTDAALRRVCNFAIRLQNQREQTRMLGLRITPWPLFLAYWYPSHIGLSGSRAQVMKVERYFLDWHRHLYDTWGLYHGLAAAGTEGTILLPSGGRPALEGLRPGLEEEVQNCTPESQINHRGLVSAQDSRSRFASPSLDTQNGAAVLTAAPVRKSGQDKK
jgi:hypothetical protein